MSSSVICAEVSNQSYKDTIKIKLNLPRSLVFNFPHNSFKPHATAVGCNSRTTTHLKFDNLLPYAVLITAFFQYM